MCIVGVVGVYVGGRYSDFLKIVVSCYLKKVRSCVCSGSSRWGSGGYQDGYRLKTVHTDGDFIELHQWD